MSNIIFLPLVHEKQSLQLCALHTVNNLLQLSSVADDAEGISLNDINEINTDKYGNPIKNEGEEGMDGTVAGISDNSIYQLNINIMQPFTKSTFDGIADGFILAESELMSDPDNTTKTSNGSKRVSLLEAARSSHRAPVVGNYSFEVIESALQSRGVEISWCNIQADMPPSSLLEVSNNDERKEMDQKVSDVSKKELVIGFVINIKGKKKSFRSSPISYMPVFGSIISPKESYHWLAITKIRRVRGTSSTQYSGSLSPELTHEENESNIAKGYCTNSWYVLDSKEKGIRLNSEEHLMNYLLQVKGEGGKIFRATTKVIELKSNR